MAKFNLCKGDKFIGRAPASREPYTGEIISTSQPYEKPLTVKRVYTHGVTSVERGYVHNNNIIERIQTD